MTILSHIFLPSDDDQSPAAPQAAPSDIGDGSGDPSQPGFDGENGGDAGGFPDGPTMVTPDPIDPAV